jgi:hypothetical protein
VVQRIPIVGRALLRVFLALRLNRSSASPFASSQEYWDERYEAGGDSGVGSYGKYAEFKADVLNGFVAEHDIESVIEFGCGDGNQLELARYPRYFGFDVSERAVESCRSRFAGDQTKTFGTLVDYHEERAELALSLDVIYHLVEDEIFGDHMRMLFNAAERYVVIYSSNADVGHVGTAHVRHRRFTDWMPNAPDWELTARVPNRYTRRWRGLPESKPDFYIFAPTRDRIA